MVILKQVRLVNWYAFNHNTFPIGRFTLIMGRNGSGKSVILDAIRYGAFGDTAFNKSTESVPCPPIREDSWMQHPIPICARRINARP